MVLIVRFARWAQLEVHVSFMRSAAGQAEYSSVPIKRTVGPIILGDEFRFSMNATLYSSRSNLRH